MNASKQVESFVKDLNEQFPTAEFSYGYIGNCGPQFDDREWHVFTQVPLPDKAQTYRGVVRRHRFLFRDGDSQNHLAEVQGERFDQWLDKVTSLIGSDAHQRWYRRIHQNDCPKCGSRSWNTTSRYVGTHYGRDKYIDVCRCTRCNHTYEKKGA